MWKFLANPLQEMVKANLIQHKILNTSYYIDFFAVNIKVIIMGMGCKYIVLDGNTHLLRLIWGFVY